MEHHFVNETTQQRFFLLLRNDPLGPERREVLANGFKCRLQFVAEGTQRG
jgi:hypothetical protein